MPSNSDNWPRLQRPPKLTPLAKKKKRYYAKKTESAEWWMDNGHKFGRPGKGKAHPKQRPSKADKHRAKNSRAANAYWKKYRLWEQEA